MAQVISFAYSCDSMHKHGGIKEVKSVRKNRIVNGRVFFKVSPFIIYVPGSQP